MFLLAEEASIIMVLATELEGIPEVEMGLLELTFYHITTGHYMAVQEEAVLVNLEQSLQAAAAAAAAPPPSPDSVSYAAKTEKAPLTPAVSAATAAPAATAAAAATAKTAAATATTAAAAAAAAPLIPAATAVSAGLHLLFHQDFCVIILEAGLVEQALLRVLMVPLASRNC